MDRQVIQFVHVLKRAGIRVSPAESLDALKALQLVPLADRAAVRAGLCATLVKDIRDVPLFEELFDLYFGARGRPRRPNEGPVRPHDHDHGTPVTDLAGFEDQPPPDDVLRHQFSNETYNLRQFFQQELFPGSNTSIHQDGEALSFASLSERLSINRRDDALSDLLQRLSQAVALRRVRGVFTPGELAAAPAGQVVQLDLTVDGGGQSEPHLEELGVDEALRRRLKEEFGEHVQGLSELIRRYLERERAREGGAARPRARPSGSPFPPYSDREVQELQQAVRRLARYFQGARSPRWAPARRGAVDASRTLRANLQHDGIPFHPVFVRRRRDRPRLVVLCDVSLSVRNAARFMLHLLYTLQNLYGQVRSFIFVRDLAEVTLHLQGGDIERAIEDVFGGAFIDVDEHSDFGWAFEVFRQNYLPAVNRRTTVLVLGDGRTNGNPPNLEALAEIRDRARRLIWLTPEPRSYWSWGGSEMPRYARLCHRVEVVRSVADLERVGRELIRWTAFA